MLHSPAVMNPQPPPPPSFQQPKASPSHSSQSTVRSSPSHPSQLQSVRSSPSHPAQPQTIRSSPSHPSQLQIPVGAVGPLGGPPQFAETEDQLKLRFQKVEMEFVQSLGNPNYLHF